MIKLTEEKKELLAQINIITPSIDVQYLCVNTYNNAKNLLARKRRGQIPVKKTKEEKPVILLIEAHWTKNFSELYSKIIYNSDLEEEVDILTVRPKSQREFMKLFTSGEVDIGNVCFQSDAVKVMIFLCHGEDSNIILGSRWTFKMAMRTVLDYVDSSHPRLQWLHIGACERMKRCLRRRRYVVTGYRTNIRMDGSTVYDTSLLLTVFSSKYFPSSLEHILSLVCDHHVETNDGEDLEFALLYSENTML